MTQRLTQTPDYWSAFEITADDSEFIANYLLEANAPKPALELAKALIRNRISRENTAIRRELERSTLYQPRKTFDVGDELLFPALKFARGTVTAKRPGNNADIGEFDVIRVKMTDGGSREFAARFPRDHKLNDDASLLAFNAAQDGQSQLSPDELEAEHAEAVAQMLTESLEADSQFFRMGNDWFLRALMADVNIGHLNLAEAVLDVAGGGPLPTSVILRDLGLPPDVANNVQVMSLNEALATDDRFDEISLNDTPTWFLRRYEPPEAFEIPSPLRAIRFPQHTTVSPSLEALATSLDDELDFADQPQDRAEAGAVVLTFPHRRAGTLPWSRALAAVLPQVEKPRVPLTFRDRVTDKSYLVWLVRDGRYIFGLADWYKQHDIPSGATVEVAVGSTDNIFDIDFKRHRPRREWVRVASQRDGRLRLDTAQRAVSCEVDDLMAVFADDPAGLDALRGEQPRDVAMAVREAFPEIAKLSPQGNVHGRTLYAVANVITRAAPRDVFAALTAAGAYVPVGDNYWHLGD